MKEATKTTIDNYIMRGIPVGDFVQAMLYRSATMAARIADKENLRDMGEIALYLVEYCPAAAIGSQEKYNDWCAGGGWAALEAKGIVPAGSNPLRGLDKTYHEG